MKRHSFETPAIVIFAFNRAGYLSKTLQNLVESKNLNEFDVYVHVDFPKSQFGAKQNQEVLDVITKFQSDLGYKKVEIRDVHLGLRKSVISFLSQVALSHRYVIVLEDDILVAEDFLDYQLNCLRKFEFEGDIGSISGFRFEKFRSFRGGDLLLSRRHSSWGWGTWGKVIQSVNWQVLENPKDLAEIKNKVSRVGKDLSNLIDLQIENRIDSWSIIFDTNMILAGRFCIHPRYQKVQNIGFTSGAHFKDSVTIPRSFSSKIDNRWNRLTSPIPRGHWYDFTIKVKRNCKIVASIAAFRRSLLRKNT